jgi:inhibitor of cysteine peptidase
MTVARLTLPLGIALLTACAGQPRHSVEIEKQSQCPVRLNSGQTLTLTLPTNPTTGYRWRVQNPAANVLRSMGPEVYSNPEDAGIVGAAGQSVWRFQGQGAGTGKLQLVLQQPWAPEVLPVQTFDCAIDVK